MSQLNLRKVLSSHDISTLIEIINYNFDQIVMNGGGPQGLRGLIGAPGMPGLQGIRGPVGEEGLDGTYIYTGTEIPIEYLFETDPREKDIYLEVKPSFIKVYQLGDEWNLIDTVHSPSTGLNKSVAFQRNETEPEHLTLINDQNIASKLFIGDLDTFSDSSGIFKSLPEGSSLGEFSDRYTINNSLLTLSGSKNQIRIICPRDFIGEDSIGKGISHSLQRNTNKLWYRICSLDEKKNLGFIINLNNYPNKLLIGTEKNNILLGGLEGETPNARVTINKSLVIGSSDFYNSIDSNNFKEGILTEGNVAVGATSNLKNTVRIFDSKISSLLIDTISSGAIPGKSQISLSSSDIKWDIIHDAYNNVNNTAHYGSLSIKYTSTDENSDIDVTNLYFANSQNPKIGVGNSSPLALLEIGTGDFRTSIGDVLSNTSPMKHYIGFNLAREQRHGSTSQRLWKANKGSSGTVLWCDKEKGFNFSIADSEIIDIGNTFSDNDICRYTRLSVSDAPGLFLSETNAFEYSNSDHRGLIIDISPSRHEDLSSEYGRVKTAIFGEPDKLGSVAICANAGVEHNHILKPQYTFENNLHYGLYLGQKNDTNHIETTEEYSIGIAAGANPGIHITPSRVGIHQRDIYERFQIGDTFTYHDGYEYKFIGFNKYKDVSSGHFKRITGYDSNDNGTSSLKSAASITYIDKQLDPTAGFYLDNYGGRLEIDLYHPGERSARLENPSSIKLYPAPIAKTGYTVHGNAPKVLLGLDSIDDYRYENRIFQKRGTLSIASQRIRSGNTTIDNYALSLYSYDQQPVFGMSTISGIKTTGKYTELDFRSLSSKVNENLNNDYTWLNVNTQYDNENEISSINLTFPEKTHIIVRDDIVIRKNINLRPLGSSHENLELSKVMGNVKAIDSQDHETTAIVPDGNSWKLQAVDTGVRKIDSYIMEMKTEYGAAQYRHIFNHNTVGGVNPGLPNAILHPFSWYIADYDRIITVLGSSNTYPAGTDTDNRICITINNYIGKPGAIILGRSGGIYSTCSAIIPAGVGVFVSLWMCRGDWSWTATVLEQRFGFKTAGIGVPRDLEATLEMGDSNISDGSAIGSGPEIGIA